jgi:hypothetical protein
MRPVAAGARLLAVDAHIPPALPVLVLVRESTHATAACRRGSIALLVIVVDVEASPDVATWHAVFLRVASNLFVSAEVNLH